MRNVLPEIKRHWHMKSLQHRLKSEIALYCWLNKSLRSPLHAGGSSVRPNQAHSSVSSQNSSVQVSWAPITCSEVPQQKLSHGRAEDLCAPDVASPLSCSRQQSGVKMSWKMRTLPLPHQQENVVLLQEDTYSASNTKRGKHSVYAQRLQSRTTKDLSNFAGIVDANTFVLFCIGLTKNVPMSALRQQCHNPDLGSALQVKQWLESMRTINVGI